MGRLIAVAGTMFILGMIFAFSIAPALATHDGPDDHGPPEEVIADPQEKDAKSSSPCSPSFYQSAIDDVVESWEAYF